MNVMISFIIPVYNKNEYQLTKCLDSINKLSFIKYQIILVNDGSEAKLSNIYENLAKRYGCQYYYQKNRGVSSARNLGLKKATGNYVFFVDADDCINVNKIKSTDLQKSVDLIIYDVKVKYKDGQETVFKLNQLSQYPKKKDILKMSLKNGIMNWSVAKLYSRKYLIENNLFFDESIYSGEDFDFIIKVMEHNPSIYYIPKVVYVYLINEDTSKLRILKHPLESLNDELIIYRHRLMILKMMDEEEKKEDVVENTVNAIFEIYIILTKYSLSNARKYNSDFVKSIKELTADISYISRLTRLKIILIRSKCYLLINTYADIRRIYKKTFKKNNLI